MKKIVKDVKELKKFLFLNFNKKNFNQETKLIIFYTRKLIFYDICNFHKENFKFFCTKLKRLKFKINF
ncbi:hypothetical protein EHP00_1703 [Ecytonucleospora hepatopenaei]|uniref:Uncharacterized protein n=1 Tax=Ecytonucleospora hepatopenaei TaxID=646526 RepID=A0A1W0E2D0_9MICR|nr:hypothetical protein EHP00_1703 [Ecytonucleospora hepatopenaei]